MHVTRDDIVRHRFHARDLEFHQQAGMIARQLHISLAWAPHLSRLALLVGLLAVYRYRIAPPHLVAALAAHGFNINFFVRVAVDELVRDFQNIGVEGAGKALVARDHDQQHALFRPR